MVVHEIGGTPCSFYWRTDRKRLGEGTTLPIQDKSKQALHGAGPLVHGIAEVLDYDICVASGRCPSEMMPYHYKQTNKQGTTCDKARCWPDLRSGKKSIFDRLWLAKIHSKIVR